MSDKFQVVRYSPEAWADLAEHAHKACFNEYRSKDKNTFDFVLACVNEHEIYAYATIIMMDDQTAYMQHGGAFPNARGQILAKRTYAAMIDRLRFHYRCIRITTRILNSNIPMLKLAMSEGLLVHGCDLYKNEVYLHLAWGFDV